MYAFNNIGSEFNFKVQPFSQPVFPKDNTHTLSLYISRLRFSKFRYKHEGEKGAPSLKLTTKCLTAKWKQMHSRSLVSNSYLPVICVTYVRIMKYCCTPINTDTISWKKLNKQNKLNVRTLRTLIMCV